MSEAAHGGDGNGKKGKKYVAVDSDSESSSIGIPSDDDVEDHGEVQSRISGSGGALNSLASLETSLSIKKGLSLHYDGRSKSYSNLAEERLVEATELAKQEHALNKKRRLINISQKFRKYSKKPFNSIIHQSSMPVFPSKNYEEDDDDAENGAMEDEGSKAEGSDLDSAWRDFLKPHNGNFKSFEIGGRRVPMPKRIGYTRACVRQGGINSVTLGDISSL